MSEFVSQYGTAQLRLLHPPSEKLMRIWPRVTTKNGLPCVSSMAHQRHFIGYCQMANDLYFFRDLRFAVHPAHSQNGGEWPRWVISIQ
jgi:hypothetical protein